MMLYHCVVLCFGRGCTVRRRCQVIAFPGSWNTQDRLVRSRLRLIHHICSLSPSRWILCTSFCILQVSQSLLSSQTVHIISLSHTHTSSLPLRVLSFELRVKCIGLAVSPTRHVPDTIFKPCGVGDSSLSFTLRRTCRRMGLYKRCQSMREISEYC